MSRRSRKVLAILCGITLGSLGTYYGAVELIHSRQLATRGLTTTGEVLETEDRVSGKFRRHNYYVSVRFQSKDGRAVRKRVGVDEDVFRAAEHNPSVKVFYLAEDPTICAAGESVPLRYGYLLLGIVFLFGAGYLIVFFKAPADPQEAVEAIEDGIKNLTTTKFTYIPADPRHFGHLDLSFYDRTQQGLEADGYRHVGDQENLTLRKPTIPRTFIRFLIGPDNATMAGIYHFKPGWMLGVLGARDVKVLDLETAFSNKCFVCTSNAEMAGKLDSPPEINALRLPAATTRAMLLEIHQRRIGEYLRAHPGIELIKVKTIEEVHRVQDEQQRIKAEFRKKFGISKTELERLAGEKSPGVDSLHDTLSQRRATS